MAETLHRTLELDWRAASGDVVPAVLSTEAPVVRSFGNEILRHTLDAINMERFPLPVIASHDQTTIPVGVAENPQIVDGKLRADIRFGKRPEARQYLEEVQSGIIRSLSVGYRIDAAEEAGNDYIATRWTPYETSIVACPADIGAGFFRSMEAKTGEKMDENTETVDTVDTVADVTSVAPQTRAAETISAADIAKATERALAAERERVKGIKMSARAAKLDEAFSDDLIERGVPLIEAREAILQKWSDSMSIETGHVRITRDETQTRRSGIENALLARMNVDTLDDNGRQYIGETLLEMGQRVLPRQVGESQGQFAMRLLSTSDMPNILANVANKSLLKFYQEAPKNFDPIITRTTVNDFKTNTVVNTSNYPSLLETIEGADYTEGSITDKKETFSVKSYARMLSFTRQMMINDDLSALDRITRAYGFAVARLESDLVWGAVTANAAMADSVALFHASHGNLGTAGAPSDTTFAEAIKLFRKQTGLGGEYLNLMPQYICAPAALENAILKVLAPVQATQTSNNNIYAGRFTLITEPRLDAASATAWYLVGSPMACETIWLATISGQSPIITENQYDFDSGSWKIKVVADRGVAVVDHRNMFKNAG